MSNSLESRLNELNEAITEHLDNLETSLPDIPGKALSATRASARRINDIVESMASSIRSRAENVADDTTEAVKTTTGQARSAAGRSADRAQRGAKQTAGQARSAARRSAQTVERGVAETTGQARTQAKKTAKSVRRGVSETTGQARTQAKKTASSVADEVEGALDDAKLAADPGDLKKMSKAELYERAQALDIDGRSGMSKAELVSALQKA